jgi:Domain of unknown function (DUF4389)
MEPHPIQMAVEDDLQRSRLTVFFRLLLAIPHLVWYFIWSFGAFFVAIVNWFLTLIKGASPASLHDFFASYVRYTTHLFAYLCLAANPWPGFMGKPSSYPVDVEIGPPERQNRWKTFFRIFLAIPALMLASVLVGTPGLGGGGGGGRGREGDEWWFQASGAGLIFVIAFLAWFACLLRGRMPNGFRDLQAYSLRYNAQALGYLVFLTDRYPNSDPSSPPAARPPDRPAVQMRVDDDLRRSRITVFFRLLLFLPHLVWLLLWTIAVYFVVIASWVVALVIGRVTGGFHRFIAAYLRYYTHVMSYLFIVANPFPGFTGAPGVYPVDIEIDPPQPQARWRTLLRFFLAIPAFIVSAGLNSALFFVGLFGWFVGLFTGRMPEGLRNLGAFALRYAVQTDAYFFLLTDRYPYSGPWEWGPPVETPAEPAPGPEAAAA